MLMIEFTDYYHLLRIPQNASKEEVKKAYRRLARKQHPDIGGTNDDFIRLKKAFDTLYNDSKRIKYDKKYEEYIAYYRGDDQQHNDYTKTSYRYKTKSKNHTKYHSQQKSKHRRAQSGESKRSSKRKFHTVKNNPKHSNLRREVFIWRVATAVLFSMSFWLMFELSNEKNINKHKEIDDNRVSEQLISQEKYNEIINKLTTLENEYINLERNYNTQIDYIKKLESEIESYKK